jgi:hypothetical protein
MPEVTQFVKRKATFPIWKCEVTHSGKKKSDISNSNALGHLILPKSQRPGEEFYKRSPLLD